VTGKRRLTKKEEVIAAEAIKSKSRKDE